MSEKKRGASGCVRIDEDGAVVTELRARKRDPGPVTKEEWLALADRAERWGQLVQARAIRAVAEAQAADDLPWLQEAIIDYRVDLARRRQPTTEEMRG